jgi:hypothetical protein
MVVVGNSHCTHYPGSSRGSILAVPILVGGFLIRDIGGFSASISSLNGAQEQPADVLLR